MDFQKEKDIVSSDPELKNLDQEYHELEKRLVSIKQKREILYRKLTFAYRLKRLYLDESSQQELIKIYERSSDATQTKLLRAALAGKVELYDVATR